MNALELPETYKEIVQKCIMLQFVIQFWYIHRIYLEYFLVLSMGIVLTVSYYTDILFLKFNQSTKIPK